MSAPAWILPALLGLSPGGEPLVHDLALASPAPVPQVEAEAGARARRIHELELDVARLSARLVELEHGEGGPDATPEPAPAASEPVADAHPAGARGALEDLALARTARRAGRPELALAVLEDAAADAAALHERALALEALGRFDEARDAAARAAGLCREPELAHVLAEDLAFLRWRADAGRRLAERAQAAEEARR